MLHIYKASAGAGKTYTLTLEYIKLLFLDPKNYRKTLAVTFTNNACGEMKSRILQALYNLSFDPKAKYTKELNALGYSEDKIQETALSLYKDILHKYSFFYIETIDSFTQKVIRNFAKDLGLPPKFTLQLRNEEILETLVRNLLIHSLDNEVLHQTLVNFTIDDIEANKSNDIKKEIIKESSIFFNEKYQAVHETKSDNETKQQEITKIFKQLEDKINAYKKRTSENARKAIKMIEDANLNIVTDFKGGKRNPILPIQLLERGDFSSCLKDSVTDVDTVLTKKNPREQDIRNLYDSEFPEILQTLTETQERKEYRTAEEIVKHKQGIILSQFIQNEIDDYCKNENTFFIAFSNKLLKTIINGSDTPFVYEKIGQTINNIMIDEFQDTSKMQWENFKPIIQNLLSSLNKALIIGDVKQSIYRFRNGDWKLLHNLDKDPQFNSENVHIPDNHRSLRNIVSFNNTFFKEYSKQVENTFNAKFATEHTTIRDIYNDCEQGITQGDGGCVEINLINHDKSLPAIESKELLLDTIFEKVVSLLRLGRKADEIVFLCYKNKDIEELVTFFNKKKKNPEYAEFKDALTIVSKEALLISNAPSIGFITTYLKKLIEPERKKEQDFISQLLEYYFSKINPGQTLPEHSIPRNMSLYETCEHIIADFNLAAETETPFITDFQNIIYTYSKNNNTSISQFLEHWEEIKDKTYLQQTHVVGCMSASTVHSSKGLEYPVVIMPTFIKRPQKTIHALYETGYTELPIVNLNGKLLDTTLKDAYINESYNIEIDNLNALYVACTRPREELYIYDRCTTKDTLVKNIFDTLLLNMNFEKIGDYHLQLGTPSPSKENKDQNKNSNYITTYKTPTGENQNTKLLPDRNSHDFVEKLTLTETEQEHGLLMHKILEHITSIHDIERCVNLYCPIELYNSDEKKLLSDKLQKKLSDKRISHWFDNSWDSILTEQPLLQKGGIEKRPDRMLIHGKNATIIDYKFTKEQQNIHKKQVREYMNILSLMGYIPEGYIWYVDLDEIVCV